jgi:hypothetical protein
MRDLHPRSVGRIGTGQRIIPIAANLRGMVFATPPAPVDVESAFPELVGRARTTVRLHPRSGQPTPHESSLGGPLLWPAGESWPMCDSEDHEDETDQPIPAVAVLQIYRRDVPELPFPDGTDLLQVLWCPGPQEPDYAPRPEVRWRDAASVTGPLLTAPGPATRAVSDGYLPSPCQLSPERVEEHPDGWELDEDLRRRVMTWSEEQGWEYFYHLGSAPGTEVGGWPNWIQDPDYPACTTCGAPMSHLLTIASWECDGESWRRWVPAEDYPLDRRRDENPGAALARTEDAGSMYLFTCATCPGRPTAAVTQSS